MSCCSHPHLYISGCEAMGLTQSSVIYLLFGTAKNDIRFRWLINIEHWHGMAGAGNSRVVFNVGGKHFETCRQTIRRIPETRLTHLLDECDEQEIFIDRDGNRFDHVLNYLRNGYIAHGDDDGDEFFEMLEKEAQYFGISEMANLCRSMREPLKPQESVRWRRDAIPHYWKLFLKCLLDRSLNIPFTYERNSFFYAKCIACETDFDPKCSNVYSANVEEWSALGHHMNQMCGRVEKLIGQTCVLVKWDNGVITHLPNTAVKRTIPVEGRAEKNHNQLIR